MKKYAIFHPHFYISISALTRLPHTGQKFSEKIFCKGVQLYFEILLLSFIHKIFEQSFYLYITARMAVRYGTFRICALRTSHLEPYRTSVPYFSSIFEAYPTNVPYPYHYKKGVPYFLAKIETYRTYAPYCAGILAFDYSHLLLTLKSLASKSATSIHTFSVGFSCLLPLLTKSRRNERKVWEF